jgi:hypothetical protein
VACKGSLLEIISEDVDGYRHTKCLDCSNIYGYDTKQRMIQIDSFRDETVPEGPKAQNFRCKELPGLIKTLKLKHGYGT